MIQIKIFKNKRNDIFFVMMDHNKKYYGSASVQDGLLCNFIIRSIYRNQGFATQLMSFIMSSDSPPFSLIARPYDDCNISRDDLISFYERYGFKTAYGTIHGMVMYYSKI